MVGISKDSLASHARFRAKYGLTFPLLSDPEHAVMAAYGAWGPKQGEEPKEGVSRSTVVIGAEGLVERVYPKVRAGGHAQEVLEGLGA